MSLAVSQRGEAATKSSSFPLITIVEAANLSSEILVSTSRWARSLDIFDLLIH